MTKKNPDSFLYQINFNRSKYPDICERLEAAKEETGGVAWYLRTLIQKDIEANGGGGRVDLPQSSYNHEYTPPIVEKHEPIKDSKIIVEENKSNPSNQIEIDKKEPEKDIAKALRNTGGFQL